MQTSNSIVTLKELIQVILLIISFIGLLAFGIAIMSFVIHYNNSYYDLLKYNHDENKIILNDYILNSDGDIATGVIFYLNEICQIDQYNHPYCAYHQNINGTYTVSDYQLFVDGNTLSKYIHVADEQYNFVGMRVKYHIYGKINGDKITAYCIYENRDDIVDCVMTNVYVSQYACVVIITILTVFTMCMMLALRSAWEELCDRCIRDIDNGIEQM